ncbi:MAG: hypothetical protein A2928_03320 [Candidatus Taylorbacteria bacterium RIFCSPLOWO2_01_FULL_45_15b]|uniref:Glucose-6-phosphate isomerase n=1 Tax=Candidatus Taylorbacteria bacterium RIFCSPLOWO2_01_FULL_45_15b TaxID=1802319 RepID=A0A1G2NHN4_9BACT|nr:MAG: hypothetical protein A2928_03320 [Candidatus Taylorbacteria bacterium RIFCSPLOWO2_01_FULL_45_15b]
MKFIPPANSTQTTLLAYSSVRDYVDVLKSISLHAGYDTPETCLNLVTDGALVGEILRAKDELVSSRLKYVIVIGIGGSALGTKAVYDALRPSSGFATGSVTPEILFLTTSHPGKLEEVRRILESLQPDEFILCLISKSGTTLETISNFEALARYPSVRSALAARLVVISDDNSQLFRESRAKKYRTFAIPRPVGGRYSVFSAVGLVPLAFAGFNIEALTAGARGVFHSFCLTEGVENNMSLVSAAVAHDQYKKGARVFDLFVFSPELESLGKWNRQLIAESLGKQIVKGETRSPIGMTPTVSVATDDLHSVAQLYLANPCDRYETFLSVAHSVRDANRSESAETVFLADKSLGRTAFEDITPAIKSAVISAFVQNGNAVSEIIFERVDEVELGAFMQFRMIETMILGKLLGVNAFDQPNIETYKKETRKILGL